MRLINHGLVRTLALVALGFGLGWILAPQAAQSRLRVGCPDSNAIEITCADTYLVVGTEGVAISHVQVRDVSSVSVEGGPSKAVLLRTVPIP